MGRKRLRKITWGEQKSTAEKRAKQLERLAIGRQTRQRNEQERKRQRLLGAQSEAKAVAIPAAPSRGFQGMSFVRFLDFWPLDDGRSLGAVAEPWQIEFCKSATEMGPNGLPRFRRILLSLPRQSAKTEILSAFGCWRTLTIGGATISIATDLDQSKLQHGRLTRALRRNPDLADQFDLSALRGDVLWRKDGGAYWRFLPSDEASAGGHVVTTLLCDELGQFRRGSWSFIAQVSPSPAVAAGQAFFAGFKGGIQHKVEGCPLFDLMKQAEAGAADLFAYVVEGRSPASWHSNQFLAEQRAALPANIFAQLYENRWAEGEDQFLPLRTIEAAIDPALTGGVFPEPGETVILGLDLGVVKDRAVLSAVAIDRDLNVRLIRQRVWSGNASAPVDLGEVEGVTRQTYLDLGAVALVTDPWQGLYLAQRMSSDGFAVEAYHFTAGSVEKLAAGMFELFSRGRIKIGDDADLRSELQGLTTRATTGGYRWVHPSGGHDDRVVSMALACSALFIEDVAAPPGRTEITILDPGAGFDSEHGDFAVW